MITNNPVNIANNFNDRDFVNIGSKLAVETPPAQHLDNYLNLNSSLHLPRTKKCLILLNA